MRGRCSHPRRRNSPEKILIDQPRSHFGDEVEGELRPRKNLVLLLVLWCYYAAKQAWQAMVGSSYYGNQLWYPTVSDMI